MKGINLTMLVIGFTTITAWTQSFNLKPQELSIPTSPGLVLMDKSPASIEKPTNPKALSISVLNLFLGGAVEFTPYWLKNKPKLTFEDYQRKKIPFLQTLAFSVATFRTDTSSTLGGGFRTQFFRCYAKEVTDSILLIKAKLVELLVEDELNTDEISKWKNKLLDLKLKPTFNVELAGAYLGYAGPNKKITPQRSGFWLNVRWSPFKVPFSAVGLFRYTNDIAKRLENGLETSYLDYGLNISYDEEEFNLALEYVYRTDLEAKVHYDRLALVANYQLSDMIIVVASLGKDFAEVNNVLTLIGVKFGLSKEKANL